MPTEPKQDRNVEAKTANGRTTGDAIGEAEHLLNETMDKIDPDNGDHAWFAVRITKVLEALADRPSQPPQNVEAGDAVKGVVEEIDKLRTRAEFLSQIWRHPQEQANEEKTLPEDIKALLFSDRLCLALSATSSHGGQGTSLLRLARRALLFVKNNPNVPSEVRTVATNVADEILQTVGRDDYLSSNPLGKDSADARILESAFLDHAGHPIESPEMLCDFYVGGGDGVDEKLKHKIREWQKNRLAIPEQKLFTEDMEALEGLISLPRLLLAIEAADIVEAHASAIISASANAEQLKMAKGLLGLVVKTYRTDTQVSRPWLNMLQQSVEEIERFLSPASAQTPGDERQG